MTAVVEVYPMDSMNAREERSRRPGVILLVEDEEAILEIMAYALRQDGFEVLEALCIPQALQESEIHRGRIDLLITDILLEGGNGLELYNMLINRHPRMKALFVSGYAEEDLKPMGFLQAEHQLLSKPFTNLELVDGARQILEKARTVCIALEKEP